MDSREKERAAPWWQREAEGRLPFSVRELVEHKAAEGGEWIIAWALLRLAEAIDRKEAE